MKTLLTFQNSDAPVDAIDIIANNANNLDAHLHVLVIGVATYVPIASYSEAPAYDWSYNYTQAVKDTHQKAKDISKHLDKLGVSATVLPVYDSIGSIHSIAADCALFADFAVLPQEQVEKDDVMRKCFLEGVMFSANIPTLLLPKDKTVNKPVNRMVIGWHPSPNTASAVRSCIPLLGNTTDIRISIVDTSPFVYGQTPGSELATYLARHGVQASIDLLSSNGKSIAEVLTQHAVDVNSDLLVMGAYGRSRFREWLLGGTTKDVMKSITIPTLFSH